MDRQSRHGVARIFIVTSSASVFAHVVASLSAYRAGSYDLGLGFPLGTRVGRGCPRGFRLGVQVLALEWSW